MGCLETSWALGQPPSLSKGTIDVEDENQRSRIGFFADTSLKSAERDDRQRWYSLVLLHSDHNYGQQKFNQGTS